MNTRQAKPIILTAPAFEDFRGYLAVPYDQSINFTVRQINQGYSKKAFTLRGMHFQEGEHEAGVLPAWLDFQCGCGSAPGGNLWSCLQCGAVF